MTTSAIRQALVEHLGKVLTPEVAYALEVAALAPVEQPDNSIEPGQFPERTCGALTFRAERIRDIVPELDTLLQLHYTETELHRHNLALNMDYDVLLAEERAGTALQFTARHGAELVGNFRIYLRVSRHTQTKFAMEDVLFLKREHRHGRNGMRFMEYVEACVSSLGYREFRASTKLTNTAGRLLEFMGFKPVATEYVKFLKE